MRKEAKAIEPVSEKRPPGQHIFHNDELHVLALRWKEANAAGEHDKAMGLLEHIIKESTPMFESFAQHEKYHSTVGLSVLVAAAQEKVVKWLLAWEPKKGRLFSWFSACSKHAFLSELVKANQWRKRFHSTDDTLEKFIGVTDHEINKEDVAKEVRRRMESLTCRWGSPQEIGALRYLVECIADDDRDRMSAIRAAAYAYGLSPEYAKFFHSWALSALRSEFFNRVRFPVTEQDLLLLKESYTPIPDLLDFMTWDQVKQLIVRYGGMRLRIPTLDYLAKLKESHRIFVDFENSDKDPDALAAIAKRYGKTTKSAAEIYEDMCHTLDPNRSGEHYIYGEHNHD